MEVLFCLPEKPHQVELSDFNLNKVLKKATGCVLVKEQKIIFVEVICDDTIYKFPLTTEASVNNFKLAAKINDVKISSDLPKIFNKLFRTS